MRNYHKILLILLIFAINGAFTNLLSGDGFRRPFKKGDYYEYLFAHYSGSPYDTFRYSAVVVFDTLINGLHISTVQVFNEPAMGNYTVTYKFDTTSLKLYGGTYGCLDSNGNHLTIGFNMPIGIIWNTCSDTSGGAYFRSSTIDTATQSQLFFSGIPLKTVTRRDTVGGTIEGTTDYKFCEMFGFLYFYRGYGSPLGPAPYGKILVGAIIDSVTYGSVILGVQQISNEIPSRYTLQQNYPNPFNPTTKIQFSIPRAGNVSLVVYDQLGRKIQTLVDENLSAGIYEYSFQSNNLPSGVYFYELNAGDYHETKRMLLIK